MTTELKQGTLIRFAHEKDGGPVHRVVSVMHDGMIEVHDMGGYFAPHLFAVADDVGGIPLDGNPDRDPDNNGLLPCPFCGGDAKRIDIEDGDNAGGSCVVCTRCDASSNVEFEFKENFVSNWNRRAASNNIEADEKHIFGLIVQNEDGSRWLSLDEPFSISPQLSGEAFVEGIAEMREAAANVVNDARGEGSVDLRTLVHRIRSLPLTTEAAR